MGMMDSFKSIRSIFIRCNLPNVLKQLNLTHINSDIDNDKQCELGRFLRL